ncbi:MAG TPA: peptidase S41 [Prevotellaceae bacterium]|nr:peptidase S41 [Prevotellaceae bacterium]
MRQIHYILVTLLVAMATGAQGQENSNSATSRNLDLFSDIYKQLDLFYVDTLNADTVIGWGIRSMLRQVDPFTDFYPEDDDELRQMSTGKYAGIGCMVRYSSKEKRTVISEPYEGTPCQQAGLLAGDVLLSVDGHDTYALPVDKVSEMLRGEAGTSLDIKVRRGEEEKTFHVTRQTIQMPSVDYWGMLDDSVGYIFLEAFREGAFREVRDALGELRGQGARSLVLDLRGNGGGAVDECVNIASLFLPRGQHLMSTKGKLPSTNYDYRTALEPVDTLMPIVLMVDGGSASCSEILAGGMQDLDRAVLLGERTFGKGLVQSVRELDSGGTLKMTTCRYYIPSGRCIQAYDYRHLNADGSAKTLPDSLTHVFHTAGGREVRDGGGVMPDVKAQPDSLPTMIYDLTASDEFFAYTTRYAREHADSINPMTFTLSDREYADFVSYIQGSGLKFSRRSAELLHLLRRVSQSEGYADDAKAQFDALEEVFSKDVTADLEHFREPVKKALEDEIVLDACMQRGAIRRIAARDKNVKKAAEILRNKEEYNKILGK